MSHSDKQVIYLKIKGLLSIGFTDIVGTVISATFWFLLASIIEPEELGEIFYFLGIAGLASYISLIGTENTIIVYVSKKIKIQSTFNLLSLVVAGVSTLIIILIFSRVDVSLIMLGYVINTLAMGDILGKKNYKSYSKYFILQKFLTLSLGFGFYYLFDVQGIIYALALTYVGYSIRVFKGFKEYKIDFSLLKPRIGFIMNNYSMQLARSSQKDIGKLIIGNLIGFTILGNYALASQVIGVMSIFTTVVFKYILSYDSNGEENKKLKQLTVIFSVGIAGVGYFLSPIIIPELFPKYNDSLIAIQIMSLSIIPGTISAIYTSKFLGLEKSRFVLISAIISWITLIVATIVLGPIWNISGLAIAFVLAQSFEAVSYIIINKKYKLR